jgi:hypothetical protein
VTYSPNFRGYTGKGSSRQLQTSFQNGTVSQINKSIPVSVNTSSQIEPIDVSDEASVLAMVGLAGEDIPSAATGLVVDTGRLEEVTTAFAYGDAVYVSKTGGLTNVKPEIGVGSFVEGDFVIFVGVIVKNEFNPLKKDIKLMLSVIGQL